MNLEKIIEKQIATTRIAEAHPAMVAEPLFKKDFANSFITQDEKNGHQSYEPLTNPSVLEFLKLLEAAPDAKMRQAAIDDLAKYLKMQEGVDVPTLKYYPHFHSFIDWPKLEKNEKAIIGLKRILRITCKKNPERQLCVDGNSYLGNRYPDLFNVLAFAAVKSRATLLREDEGANALDQKRFCNRFTRTGMKAAIGRIKSCEFFIKEEKELARSLSKPLAFAEKASDPNPVQSVIAIYKRQGLL